MAIIRGFQPFDESSILSTRSKFKKKRTESPFFKMSHFNLYLIAFPEKETLLQVEKLSALAAKPLEA